MVIYKRCIMARVTTNEQNYYDIADAIRGKLNVETLYLPSEMADAIDSIPVGSELTIEDEGKVVVEESGSYVLASQTSQTVTQNGTYDTTTNNEVIVNVSGSGDAKIKWNEQPDYTLATANTLICTLDGRPYYKTTNDVAFVAYAYRNGTYTCPVLVSKSQDGVKFTTVGTTYTYEGTIEYDGYTWYYCSSEYSMQGDLISSEGFAKKLEGGYPTLRDAAIALLEIASPTNVFGSKGVYEVPSGYDGWGDVKFIPNLQAKSVTRNGSVVADSGYDGLSTVTVNVSATSWVLPNEYQEVEYIDFTPNSGIEVKIPVKKAFTINGTQYTNDSLSFIVEATASADVVSSSALSVFGYRQGAAQQIDYQLRFTGGIASVYERMFGVNPDTEVSYTADVAKLVRGPVMNAPYDDAFIGRYSTYSSGAIQAFDGKIYYVKGYTIEDSALIFWFVPCREKATSKIGFYDLVAGEFYSTAVNDSTGQVTAGPDVSS